MEQNDNINYIREGYDKFKKFVTRFSNSRLTFKTYDDFIKLYKIALDKYLPMINEQLFILRYRLMKTGYIYDDNKFNNFAFTTSDKNIDYMGIGWGERNKIGDKYIFLHILDWDGLDIYNKSQFHKNQILERYLKDDSTIMPIYSGMILNVINRNVFTSENNVAIIDLFLSNGISKDIVDIMTHRVVHKIVPEKKPELKTIEDAMDFIKSKNPKPYNLQEDIISKLSGEFDVVDSTENKIILIKSSSDYKNFVKLKYNPITNEYTMTCLDDSKNIVTDTMIWPKCQTTSRDIKIIVNMIEALYAL